MNMKKYVLAFFLCFISITPILAQRDHIDISNYILCINSYAESSPWSNRMISTVSEYVQKNPKLALYAEHMNTLMIDNEYDFRRIQEYDLSEIRASSPTAANIIGETLLYYYVMNYRELWGRHSYCTLFGRKRL